MTYTPHTLVKPEYIAETALALVERELIVPTLFARKGVEEFKGKKNDTINMTVPGVLPAHDYEWRNDRSQAIKVDQYTERTVAVQFGGHAYSAVEVTDEQNDFDLKDWGKFLTAQARAVARKLEHGAVKKLTEATYSVTLGAKAQNILNDIIEARRVLNRFGVPKEGRILLVGSDIETILQTNEVLNRATGIGDAGAASALGDATLGKFKGFTIIASEDIAADEAYALTPNAFAFINAAFSIPEGIVGHTASGELGIALRWMRDYDANFFLRRSVVDSIYGYGQVTDPVVYWDPAKNMEVVSDELHNVRAIKLKLGGSDKYMTSGDAGKVGTALGLKARPAATTAAG